MAAARLRAREVGRWALQAAPTGYSAIISPGGRVVARTGLETAEVLTGTIELRSGQTPYTRTGDAPALLATVLLAGAGLSRRRPRGKAPVQLLTTMSDSRLATR